MAQTSLVDSHGLLVPEVDINLRKLYLLELLTLMTIFAQASHGSLQGLPGHTFACTCLAHNHVAMPSHFAVKDLNDLGHKFRHHLHEHIMNDCQAGGCNATVEQDASCDV